MISPGYPQPQPPRIWRPDGKIICPGERGFEQLRQECMRLPTRLPGAWGFGQRGYGITPDMGGPTNFVLDTFTGADGTSILSHTGELGATWTRKDASTNLAEIDNSNRLYYAVQNTNARCIFTASGTPASAEYDLVANLHTFSSNLHNTGLVFRLTDINNYYFVLINTAASLFLYKVVGGAFTQLQTGGFTPGASDHEIKITVRNAAKTLFLDGSQIFTDPDNSLTSAGVIGITFDGTSPGGETTGYHWSDITGTNV